MNYPRIDIFINGEYKFTTQKFPNTRESVKELRNAERYYLYEGDKIVGGDYVYQYDVVTAQLADGDEYDALLEREEEYEKVKNTLLDMPINSRKRGELEAYLVSLRAEIRRLNMALNIPFKMLAGGKA